MQNDGQGYYYSSQEILTDFKQSILIFFRLRLIHKDSHEYSGNWDPRSRTAGVIHIPILRYINSQRPYITNLVKVMVSFVLSRRRIYSDWAHCISENILRRNFSTLTFNLVWNLIIIGLNSGTSQETDPSPLAPFRSKRISRGKFGKAGEEVPFLS